MKSAEELWELLREAYGLPYGAAQIALIDQLLRHVDASGDGELAFTTRMVATTAYVYGGEPAKAFVTFARCLAEFDQSPEPYHARMAHTLLWDFKAMINALLKFPEVPLERTYAVLDDMERRYRVGGHSPQAVYKQRFQVAQHLGRSDDAATWYERWVTAPRDDLSDCIGCDPSDKVAYLAFHRRDAEAVELATPVLAGELTCTEQPQTILNQLMEPYLRIGRLDDAVDAHRRAYRLQRGKLADLADLGDHIAFCARTGNEHRGLELLQRHVDWLDSAPSPAAEMTFAAAGALLLRRLVALGHGGVTVRVRARGDVPAGVLAEELAGRATVVSLRFDARNSTDTQSRRVVERLSAEPYGIVLPLSPTSRRGTSPAPVAAAPPEPDVPPDAGPAELLDLAEEHQKADRDAAMVAALAAFDERCPDPESLGPALAARYATLRGAVLWDGDPDAAAEVWERAVALFESAGEPDEASSVRGRLGVTRCLQGALDAGSAQIRGDVEAQERSGDPRRRAGAWSRLAHMHLLFDDPVEANVAQDRADAAAAEVGDPRLLALFAMRRAQNRAAAGRHDEAVAAAEEARAFYRVHGPVDRRAVASILCGQLATDPETALVAFDEALAASTEVGPALTARLGRGRALMRSDRAAEAVTDLVEAVAICTEQDLAEGGAYARQDLANAYRLADRPVEAAEVAEEALAGFDALDHEDAANDTRLLLAGLYRRLGDPAGALALYGDLRERLKDNPAGRGQVAEQHGQLLFELDRDAEAAEVFGAAAEDLRSAGDVLGELRVLRRRLSAYWYADAIPEAEQTMLTGLDRYAELPPELAARPEAVWGRVMFGYESARLYASQGRHLEASPHLDGAGDRLRELGADDDADRVDCLYAEVLLRTGSADRAEAILASQVGRLASDDPGRPVAVRLLIEVLETRGRTREAAELRKNEGLNDR